jgi:hypothetical protein
MNEDIKAALVVAFIIVCTFFGIYAGNVYHKAQLYKDEKAKVEQLIQEREDNSKTVQKLITNFQITSRNYDKLRSKQHEIKVTNSDCSLTPDAVQLWNNSTQGMSSSTDGTPTVGGASVADALDNKLRNDEITARNRERNKALRDWYKEHYGI